MVALLGMVILVGMGEKMAERFLPLYIVALGGGAIYVGLLNGLDNLLSALYSFPGGYIADRYGTKRALLIFNVIAMGGFVIVILIPSVWAVIVGSFFFLSWTAISSAGNNESGCQASPQEQTHDGCINALADPARADGTGTFGWRSLHCDLGRNHRRPSGIYRGTGTGDRCGNIAANNDSLQATPPVATCWASLQTRTR